jgi:nucleotide-binding universal stress UspA family protein
MKLLVPIDGSAASLRAVAHAIGQAKARPGTELLLINIQNLATLGVTEGAAMMPADWLEEEEKLAAAAVLGDAERSCREAGVRCSLVREHGPIAATIDRVAREAQVDQIIMGTRGRGGVAGLVLGSVAMQVLHLIEVPVTLVK